jgi:citrate lyase beta subunit
VEEVTYHRALIESYEEGIKKGLGAVRFRDAMIDQAMYERSMELLSNQT